ncbi:MAG: Glu/Leu/Phe/Val dehydrogenase dimerization domain-containing protein [Nocardioidaceae bacterium]
MTTAITMPVAAGTRRPYLEVTWTDPVTERTGYLVIDRLVRGVCSGGLRMREGCTLDEVRGLAAGMTLKEGLHYRPENHYVPLGGAKGGIDCSPHDPAARGVLLRYLQGIRAILERHWTTGEDLGLQQRLIDEAISELGLRSSIQAIYPLLDDERAATDRMERAFGLDSGGIGLDELVGGLGVAESVLTVLDADGRSPIGTRVVVQGFGSMGGATARFLAAAGMVVVGLVDARGAVVNPDGLDVESMLQRRDRHGEIDRSALRPDDREIAADAWLGIPTDVLVPAAVSYCITPENQAEISATLVAEAANLPVLPQAEALLAERGVRVIPDFVANSATNAWWWWTLFGDVAADVDEAFAKTRTEMRSIVNDVLADSSRSGSTLRESARTIVADRLAAIDKRFGDG